MPTGPSMGCAQGRDPWRPGVWFGSYRKERRTGSSLCPRRGSSAQIVSGLRGRGVHERPNCEFIENWEVESYREKVAS